MSKIQLLKKSSFGARVAEEETTELARYFVQTEQWDQIYKGDVDVIRGEKGAGKSAIYSLLNMKMDELFDQSILLVAGEKPRGAPVFRDIVSDPPANEQEFVGLWKLYVLVLVANKIQEFSIKSEDAEKVYVALNKAGLLDLEFDLVRTLQRAKEYVKSLFAAESIEGGLVLEPNTGLPAGVTGKITFREPASELRKQGFESVDALLGFANKALEKSGYKIWVLLDRLDVAFAETEELEANALRALFRAYRDMDDLTFITIKIFLRSDIWKRITESGFREASHITRVAVLDWKDEALLNLLVRRILNNAHLVDELKIDSSTILSDFNAQTELFYRLFPAQVEQGSRKPSTLDWMITRCADGTQKTAPRELIHLLTALREKEIARLERGEESAPDDQLFDRSVFKEALPDVSEARLVQNLYAEHPDLKPFLTALHGEKTEQTAESLQAIWKLTAGETAAKIQQLVDIGFFQPRGKKEDTTYWVPFLYRDALSMSQGLADE